MVFHPRKRVGFGWTNGEGNERVWALCSDTIANERIMGVSGPRSRFGSILIFIQPNRRLFLLVRKFEYIASLKIAAAAAWLRRKLKAIDKAEEESTAVLEDICKSGAWDKKKLLDQWELQKKEQLSVRACK